MVLVLAIHTVEAVTAKVPFAVILLQDFISNKRVPPDFKCRQMIPSSGSRSTSLWDCSDPDELLIWLNENINVDCVNEVFEVQEEFAIGLGELARQRAAERALAGTKDAADKTVKAVGAAAGAVGHQAKELDHKLRISERAAHTVEVVKESQIAKSTAAALGKVGNTVAEGGRKIMANDTVAKGTEAVSASFKRLGSALGSLTRRRSADEELVAGGGGGLTPSFVQDGPADHEQPFHLPSSADAPAPRPAPAPAAPPASPAAEVVAPSQQSAPKFTLGADEP